MPDISLKNDSIIIEGLECFDLARSCSCGQCFRWVEREGGYFGVASGRGALVSQLGGRVAISPGREEDIGFWINYFDLSRDYAAIERRAADDAVLGKCLEYAHGIRIFNQDPFETLISFIISANNNIKRIMGIVERLSMLAGQDCGGYYSFPDAQSIASLTVEQLTGIGAGYRAPYILNSARMAADGYDLEALRYLPHAAAQKELLKFPGVGPKVADCILLFSLGHTGAFPMDVWMKRAMLMMYFDGTQPEKKQMQAAIDSLGEERGILQQYIFHYARENLG